MLENMKKFSFKELANQFIKFGIVGVLNNGVFILFYYVFLNFKIHYIISNTLAYIISILNAYYFNKKFVFKTGSKGINSLLKTYVSYGITFAISTVLLYSMVNFIGISSYIAPIISLCITIPVNFILNKYWTFK
ncbi:MAG: GtrA family protein [Proteocatella sp.]